MASRDADARRQAGLAGLLAWTVSASGTVSYAVGGFAAPYGIELVVDGLSGAIALLVAVVSLGVLAYARQAGPHSNAFYGLYLLLVAGLTGMTVTGDVFNLYVFLEITGLAAYGLVASGRDASAAVAALKYLIIGTVGARCICSALATCSRRRGRSTWPIWRANSGRWRPTTRRSS